MPSINNRRGHPWIIRRTLWDEIMKLQAPLTMRDFMRSNQEISIMCWWRMRISLKIWIPLRITGECSQKRKAE